MSPFHHRKLPVALAIAIPTLLAGSLAARLAAQAGGIPGGTGISGTPTQTAPAAAVPAPVTIPEGILEIPRWHHFEAHTWPIRHRTDLDMFAPLGTGEGNAAAWFASFARIGGDRAVEGAAAQQRRIDHPGLGKILPADDPLLLEAEPWVDQATMRFYPDFFPLQGVESPLPNLLLMLTLARTWVARGMEADDTVAAMEDFRRAIRLGRLLRQEDVFVINDLVGLSCIRIGLEAIYGRAAAEGDQRMALAASIAVGEAAPQRLFTAAKITDTDIRPFLPEEPAGWTRLDLPDARLDTLIERSRIGPDRRFRVEAAGLLGVVRELGTDVQVVLAEAALRLLCEGDDPILAKFAGHLLNWHPSPEELRRLYR